LQNLAKVPAVPVPPEQIPSAAFESNVYELLLSSVASIRYSVPAMRCTVSEKSVVEPFMSEIGIAVPDGTARQLLTGPQLPVVVVIVVPLMLRVRVIDCPPEAMSSLQNLILAEFEEVPVLPPEPLVPPPPEPPPPGFVHLPEPEQSGT
jgi:hypothetical protein